MRWICSSFTKRQNSICDLQDACLFNKKCEPSTPLLARTDFLNADHEDRSQLLVSMIHVLFMYWARLVSSGVDAYLSSHLSEHWKVKFQKYPWTLESKIPKISSVLIFFKGPFWGAYVQREICVSKLIGLALFLEGNLLFFFCFTLYLRAISNYTPPPGAI